MTEDRLAWYQEAKFGLFIHWGPYSVAGVEASWPIMVPELAAAAFGKQPYISESEYVALPQEFNPVDYDPRTWVQMAQKAGMRYIVFTTKHHDGFCMFDAPGTDYKITNTPYGRDVCAELAKACAEADMCLGFYYSHRSTCTIPAIGTPTSRLSKTGWASPSARSGPTISTTWRATCANY